MAGYSCGEGSESWGVTLVVFQTQPLKSSRCQHGFIDYVAVALLWWFFFGVLLFFGFVFVLEVCAACMGGKPDKRQCQSFLGIDS